MAVAVRGQTIVVEQKLVTQECCYAGCGVLFAMTEDFDRARREDHRWWYCPNGHQQQYSGKTEAEKLKEQLAEERRQRQRAEQNIAYWQDEASEHREKAEHERRRANGYKGHATRISKRVKNGVCICCNRTFKDLAAHMATKHPTFTPQDSVEEPFILSEATNG
jgi:elongation factor P hydroxylase